MSETFKQEMPPLGGYRPLNFERTLPKKFLTFRKLLFVSVVQPMVWLYFWRKNKRYKFVEELENLNCNIGIEPCLLAERDRGYLKEIRRNRDEEADLMKNVPGWEVGKLYEERVFRSSPADEFIDPDINEFYSQTRYLFLTECFHFEHRR